MSLPYIPGWWDELNKNNAVSNLVQQLPQFIQPDRVANKKLEAALRENPMLAAQISNMDDGTRKLLEQSFGFKKQSPITSMPVGDERKMRELNTGLLSETLSTPTGKEDYIKKMYGKRTQVDVMKEQQDISANTQAIDLNKLNIALTSGKVKDMERTQKTIDAAISKYPDLTNINYKQLAHDLVFSNKPIDPSLINATTQDEGAKTLLELGIKSELMKMENTLALRLRTAKDPNTSALLLRTLTEQANQIETSQQRLLQQKQIGEKYLAEDRNYMILSMSKKKEDQDAAAAIRYAKVGKIEEYLSTYQKAALDIQKRTEDYSNTLFPKQKKKDETPEERAARLRKLAGLP